MSRSSIGVLVSAMLVVGAVAAGAEEDCDRCRISLRPLDLSRTPSHEELVKSGQLGGALSPTGPESSSTSGDRLLFGQGMDSWNRHDYKKALPLLKKHIQRYPASPWRAEAELHLGCEARFNGRYLEAEHYFKKIVADFGDNMGTYGEIAWKAKLRLAMLSVLRGKFDNADSLWLEIISGDPDKRRVDYARHWLFRTSLYRAQASIVRRCGADSLAKLLAANGETNATEILNGAAANPDYGFNADELIQLAKRCGEPLVGVFSDDPASLPIPFLAHYKFNHFVAVTGKDKDGSFILFDPILNQAVSLTAEQFLEEWSGVALVPAGVAGRLTAQRLSMSRLREFAGGCCGVENVNRDEGSNVPLVGGPCGDGYKLCTWAFSPVSMNLFVWDTPLWYQPAVGPAIEFTMSYNAIDSDNNLTCFGPKWVFSYHSYTIETPGSGNGTVTVFMPDGRNDVYSPIQYTNTFTPPARVFNKLTKLTNSVYKLEFPDGTTYEYGAPQGATNIQQALLSRIVDRHSNVVTMVYDGQPDPKLVAVVDAMAQTSRIQYAASGLITNIVDPFGRNAAFIYTNGHVATVTDMGGVQSVYEFYQSGDTANYVKSLRTQDGTVTFEWMLSASSWATNWRREGITATYEDGSTEVLYFNGGEDGTPSTFFTDRNGNTIRYLIGLNTAFPYQGTVVYEEFPDGSRVDYKYNSLLQTTNLSDESGQQWNFAYNSVGQLTQMRWPNGYQGDFTYTNGGYDLVSFKEAATNLIFTRTYTSTRDVATLTNGLGQATRVAYNSRGLPTNVTDAAGISSIFEYDDSNWLRAIRTGGITNAVFLRDSIGRVTNIVGPERISVGLAYDTLDRMTNLTFGSERPYEWTYETNSLLLKESVDRSGRRVRYEYDVLNRLSRIRAPDHSMTRLEYDKGVRLTSLIDAEAHRTRFAYDNRNRPAGKTYALGDSNSVSYTVKGQVETVSTARGTTNSFFYDVAGLLTNVLYASDSNTAPLRFTYNNRNLLSTMADGWSTNTYGYDVLGRLVSLSEVQGTFTQRFDYAYDSVGRLSNAIWKAGTNASVSTSYAYDSLSRITNVVSDAGTFAYSYANAGLQISTVKYPNNETANYSYDSLARLTNLLYRTPAGQATGQWSYAYDSRDYVVFRKDPNTNSYSYLYDDVGRLVENRGTRGTNSTAGYPFWYSYDKAGNRLLQSEGTQVRRLMYNKNNQLIAMGRSNEVILRGYVNEAGTGTTVQATTDSMTNWLTLGMQYVSQTQAWFSATSLTVTNAGSNTVKVKAMDRSGNISTQIVHVTNSGTNQLVGYDANGNLTNGAGAGHTWDASDRLVGIRHSDGCETWFKYDGFARLREIAEYGPSTNLTNIVRYAWNGWLPWAELDGSNRIVKAFTWGLDVSGTVGGAGGIGGLLGIRSRLGTPINYYVRTDGKGNVTEVRQSNAVTVATYSYAPFGAIITNAGAFNQPFRFQTKLFHARSGHVYFGYRFYSPQQGRWFSREPLGESASINLYAYCANNPLAYVDARGDVAAVIGVAAGNAALGVLEGYVFSRLLGLEYTKTDTVIDAAFGVAGGWFTVYRYGRKAMQARKAARMCQAVSRKAAAASVSSWSMQALSREAMAAIDARKLVYVAQYSFEEMLVSAAGVTAAELAQDPMENLVKDAVKDMQKRSASDGNP